ncbi:hypothetical protein B0H13DRAFT_1881110 [Mycena leptocephala]|nr:hypothetical protein B0H13DRAFT_1881110 [Mycena leptocephala]
MSRALGSLRGGARPVLHLLEGRTVPPSPANLYAVLPSLNTQARSAAGGVALQPTAEYPRMCLWIFPWLTQAYAQGRVSAAPAFPGRIAAAAPAVPREPAPPGITCGAEVGARASLSQALPPLWARLRRASCDAGCRHAPQDSGGRRKHRRPADPSRQGLPTACRPNWAYLGLPSAYMGRLRVDPGLSTSGSASGPRSLNTKESSSNALWRAVVRDHNALMWEVGRVADYTRNAMCP